MIKILSEKVYSNRYRDTYHFERVSDGIYKFVMDGNSMQWCRYGGKEGQHEINTNDLGMVDPSGGPYMCPGEMMIDDREVIRIFSGDFVGFEVK